MTYLAHAVRRAARLHGPRTALAAGPMSLTFEQLNTASEALAARLAGRGVGQGQVAALLLPPSIDYVVAYCALAKVGAITAGIGAHYSPAERAAMLDQAQPTVVVGTEELLTGRLPDAEIVPVRLAQDDREFAAGLRILGRDHPYAKGVRRSVDARHSTRSTSTSTSGSRFGSGVFRAAAPHQDPETIVFTSGTTGMPKGALFCAGQISAITDMDTAAQSGPMPLLVATGLSHVGFMTKLAGHLTSGNRLHLLERWRAAEALQLICQERIPVIGGVAAQVALLLRVPDFDSYDVEHIKALIIGGGPSPAESVRQARTAFGAGYSIRYSSTESGGLGTLTALDAPDEEALHTVGRPRSGTDVSIRDEAGAQVPEGEIGEVWLRAPSVMSEYWRNPDATRLALTDDGWLRTGDLGRIGPDGCLRLAGRRDEMYIRGGYNVHPQEVEAVLLDHPRVAQVAVVPRDDAVMGQIGVAFVVSKTPDGPPSPALSPNSPTLDDLRSFAADRLSRHKLPEELRLVDRLPLTSGQKVDRSALRKLIA